MKIGGGIAAKRKSVSLSQDEFAEKLNVARQTVSSWEHDVFFPDSKNLIAMCALFGCSIEELVNSDFVRVPSPRDDSTNENGSVVESLLRAWKEATDAAKAMDPVILADGVSERDRAAIISEGREAILSLEAAIGLMEAI